MSVSAACVAGVSMACGAQEHISARAGGQHLMHEIPMAIQASVLSHSAISRFNLDRFVEISERERQGVKEAVIRLRDPFSGEVVGEMAVVTDGHVPVAAVLPGIIVRVHDVAVHAGFWIAAKVAGALAVPKREHAKSPEHSKTCGQRQGIHAELGHEDAPSAPAQRDDPGLLAVVRLLH